MPVRVTWGMNVRPVSARPAAMEWGSNALDGTFGLRWGESQGVGGKQNHGEDVPGSDQDMTSGSAMRAGSSSPRPSLAFARSSVAGPGASVDRLSLVLTVTRKTRIPMD